MIIGVASGISYIDFSLALLPVALLGMGGIWIVLVWMYPHEFKNETFKSNLRRAVIYRPLLLKTLVISVGLLVAFLAGVPVALGILIPRLRSWQPAPYFSPAGSSRRRCLKKSIGICWFSLAPCLS